MKPPKQTSIRRSFLSGLLALAIVAGLSGCGASTNLTQANLDKIQPNMSSQDVKTILGEPTETKTEPIPIVGGTKTTYIYTDKNDSVVIVLKNDNVETKEGHFGDAQ